jgi:hypothetical protein
MACFEVLVARDTCQEKMRVPWFEGRCIALVAFLIGCSVLLVVGCAGTRSESPKQQGHTEATREQTRSAKAASEEARCAETRLIDHHVPSGVPSPMTHPHEASNWETNNVPGCPKKGGPLLGTDSADKLDGGDGDDEIRGLGAKDDLIGGLGSDVIYGEPGNDFLTGSTWDRRDRATSKDVLYGGPGNDELEDDAGDDVLYGGDGDDAIYTGKGEDVFYGGDGNDLLFGDEDGQRDKLYCSEGKDRYHAGKNDYVDSSCEKKIPLGGGA